MGKNYSQEDMKRILRQDIGTSGITEQKIQEAYAQIRSTGSLPAKTGRRLVFKRWMVLAAAVGLLGVSSVTALGVNGFFTHQTAQDEDGLKYTFEVNYELTPHEVEITPGYIPEGYEQYQTLKYDKEGYRQNGISISAVNAAYLEANGATLDVENVKSVEETKINGMEAQLITIDYDPQRVTRLLDKRIYLFNEEEGYVGIVFGGNDLTMEELKKVAENLTFTVTEEVEYVSADEKEREEEDMAAWEEEQEAIQAFGVPQEYICKIGETMNWMLERAQADYTALESDEEYRARFRNGAEELMANYADTKGVEVTVTGVEVLDSIAEFPQEGFFQYDDLAPCINEDGTAKPYTRVTYEEEPVKVGDGTKELSREEVTPKFVKVTLQAKNLEEETVDFWAGAAPLMRLEPVEGGNYQFETTYSEPLNWQEYQLIDREHGPIYFDQSPYAGEVNGHFFFRDLAPDETLTYTLLYAVDEDRLDNMYLCFGTECGTMDLEHNIFYQRYVDISQ